MRKKDPESPIPLNLRKRHKGVHVMIQGIFLVKEDT